MVLKIPDWTKITTQSDLGINNGSLNKTTGIEGDGRSLSAVPIQETVVEANSRFHYNQRLDNKLHHKQPGPSRNLNE